MLNNLDIPTTIGIIALVSNLVVVLRYFSEQKSSNDAVRADVVDLKHASNLLRELIERLQDFIRQEIADIKVRVTVIEKARARDDSIHAELQTLRERVLIMENNKRG